jgi:hypothetical protein
LRTPPLTRGSRTRSSGSREATGEFRVHARPDETRRDETRRDETTARARARRRRRKTAEVYDKISCSPGNVINLP